MRREVRTMSPHGAPLVELYQRKLRSAVASGNVPKAAARITEGYLAALQICVRIGELSPVEAILQAVEAVGLAMGEPRRTAMTEDLHAIRDPARAAWTTRRVCGLVGIAATLRIERLIALDGASRILRADVLRMALEAACAPPLPWL